MQSQRPSARYRSFVFLVVAAATLLTVGGVLAAARPFGLGDTASESPETTTDTTPDPGRYTRITTTFPPKLADEAACDHGAPNADGAVYLLCTVAPNSPLAQGISDGYNIVFIARADRVEAETTLRDWRVHDAERLVETTAGAAGALVPDCTAGAQYVSVDSGLVLEISVPLCGDDAVTFLQRARLLH